MPSTKRLALALTGYVILSMSACASVPKETVTLSRMVGQDIAQLQSGYRETIRFSFDQMRQAGLSVIDNVWTPVYLKSFVAGGQLVEAAKAEQTERIEYWRTPRSRRSTINGKSSSTPFRSVRTRLWPRSTPPLTA